MATPKQTDPQYKLRMPAGLKERIELAAQANNRSMNAEIVSRLEASFSLMLFTGEAKEKGIEIESLLHKIEMLERIISIKEETISYMKEARETRREHAELVLAAVQAASRGAPAALNEIIAHFAEASAADDSQAGNEGEK